MFTKNLLAIALVSALGFSVSAQARDFDHRDGYQGSHRVEHRDNFRHGHRAARHHHHHRHAGHHGQR